MKKFTQTGLWAMLRNPKSASNGFDADAILDEFIVELQHHCREEKNIAERTRTLWLARNELCSHSEYLRDGLKKNVPLHKVACQAVYLIDCELDLIRMDLEYPERFIEFPSDNPPLALWGGRIADFIEYMIAPQAKGLIQHPSGKPMNFEETTELVEKIYGITVPNSSDRRGRVLDRQKNTTFQDEMRQAFLDEVEKG